VKRLHRRIRISECVPGPVVSGREDPLAAPKGVAVGLALSAALWAGLYLGWRLVAG
jgi:hypothetical protein